MRSRTPSYSKAMESESLFADDKNRRGSLSFFTVLIILLVVAVGGGSYFYHINNQDGDSFDVLGAARNHMKEAVKQANANAELLSNKLEDLKAGATQAYEQAYEQATTKPRKRPESATDMIMDLATKGKDEPRPMQKRSLTEKLDDVLVEKIKHDNIAATAGKRISELDRNELILEGLRIAKENSDLQKDTGVKISKGVPIGRRPRSRKHKTQL